MRLPQDPTVLVLLSMLSGSGNTCKSPFNPSVSLLSLLSTIGFMFTLIPHGHCPLIVPSPSSSSTSHVRHLFFFVPLSTVALVVFTLWSEPELASNVSWWQRANWAKRNNNNSISKNSPPTTTPSPPTATVVLNSIGIGCVSALAIALPVLALNGRGWGGLSSSGNESSSSQQLCSSSNSDDLSVWWPFTLMFALAGNLYEELLFRGFFQVTSVVDRHSFQAQVVETCFHR